MGGGKLALVITDHACERYIDYIDPYAFDFQQIRKKILSFLCSNKHRIFYKTEKVMYVSIGDLIVIFNKTKRILITLYPATEKKIIVLRCLEGVELNKHRFENRMKIKKHYINPDKLTIGISKTKSEYFITVNATKNYNISGCFSSTEKAQKFIDDYTQFYNQFIWLEGTR